METIIKRFEELSLEELYMIMNMRQEVFVVEQGIVYQDLDFLDQKSYHILIREDKNPIAYLRIIDAGAKYNETSIGRVLTTKPYRGKGYGRQIMNTALELLKKINGFPVKIDAQVYLEKFYEALGFEVISKPFILEGIRHIEMRLLA